jgi:glycosyltransferase involved in cell wall biosynthesis
MISEGSDTYLTFSHFLPWFLPRNVFSIVGVSNLEPFSEMAWKVESNAARLRLMLLRHTIITSSKRADQVIALSHACKNILAECGVSKSKIKVIPNGVDICKDHEDENIETGLPCKSPYILTVSHFYRYKNFEKLIEAFGLLSFNLKDQMQYKLIIVGKPYDKKYYDEIIGLIAKLELQDHIIIIPGLERKSLDSLYRNASLFVFTSLIENSPNILLEAMAHSLPIVSSDVAPMPEFGGDSVSYFNALSASDLAEKLSDVMEDTERATKMRILAKQRSLEYTWDNFTKSVIDICSISPQCRINNVQEYGNPS